MPWEAEHQNAQPQPEVIGRALDAFIGTWSEEQAEEVREALREFGRIDESLWV